MTSLADAFDDNGPSPEELEEIEQEKEKDEEEADETLQ